MAGADQCSHWAPVCAIVVVSLGDKDRATDNYKVTSLKQQMNNVNLTKKWE